MDATTNMDLWERLNIGCESCCGLCCVALYCMKTDGFPRDKAAGTPCQHLMADFRCAIHGQLATEKLKGCMAYDCFGAGQMVTQLYPPNSNWMTNPQQAQEMFQLFSTVFQLHQMLWYLIQAWSATCQERLAGEIQGLITEYEHMALLSPAQMLALELEPYRLRVNTALKKTVQTVARGAPGEKGRDFCGTDFKLAKLDGRDFSMSFLIGANLEGCSLVGACFLGADLRDANLKNTDLRESLFLTQMQINAAQGDKHTKLPPGLSRPSSW